MRSLSGPLKTGCSTCISVGTGEVRLVFGGSGIGVPKSVQPSGEGPRCWPQNAQKTQAGGATAVQVSPQMEISRSESSVERSRALLVTLGLRLKSARSTWVCEVSVLGLFG